MSFTEFKKKYEQFCDTFLEFKEDAKESCLKFNGTYQEHRLIFLKYLTLDGMYQKMILENTREKFPIFKESSGWDEHVLYGFYSISPFLLVYNDCVTMKTVKRGGYYNFLYGQNTEDVQELAWILSYLEHCPTFILTNDKYFNLKLESLYDNLYFDEFERGNVAEYHIKSKFKVIEDTLAIELKGEPKNLDVFGLYSMAVKQPEPFAKCVFLYRIIDYYWGKKSPNQKPADYINSLFEECFSERKYVPIHAYKWPNGKKTVNLIPKLKRKAKRILEKYKEEGKNIGKRIYERGRNGAAHGKSIFFVDKHGSEYNELIDINLVLLLLVRYLIDQDNYDYYKQIIRFKGFS